ncbi:hypothetical protein GCM10029964_091240 [Kibdelosporangium lantanae]
MWCELVAVVVAAGVGVVTNLVTAQFSWTLTVVVVLLVSIQAHRVIGLIRAEHQDLQMVRDRLLGPLRPTTPPRMNGKLPANQGSMSWLTPSRTPTPLWGRNEIRDRLVAWCTDLAVDASVARVVTGPAGVGKSRLALAVAEALPAGWVTGRLLVADGLVDRIVACRQPTLVIIEDADRMTGLELLITQAARHPDMVRLLLITRQPEFPRSLPDAVVPQIQVEPLAPIGEAADRQRWFAEAVAGYARSWGLLLGPVPVTPTGRDEDTLLVLHARAFLTVLGRTGSPGWSLRRVARELVDLEQRRWEGDLRSLPVGCDREVLAEAVTALSLSPADTVLRAAEVLRHVPQFSHDSAHESRVVVARWVRRRYPPGPDGRSDLQPHLVGERLVLDTLARTPQLLQIDSTAVVPVLTQACDTFPDAVHLLTAVLTQHPLMLASHLRTIVILSIADTHLDGPLADLVDTSHADPQRELATLTIPSRFPSYAAPLAISPSNVPGHSPEPIPTATTPTWPTLCMTRAPTSAGSGDTRTP